MSTTTELVGTRREGRVFVITLQREAKRNAVDRALADALDAALNTLDDDADLDVGILSGGNRFFCAGSDLASRGDYVTERRQRIERTGRRARRRWCWRNAWSAIHRPRCRPA